MTRRSALPVVLLLVLAGGVPTPAHAAGPGYLTLSFGRTQSDGRPVFGTRLANYDSLWNEIYLRLVDIRRVQWQDRAHFFAMAARLMRRVLVDFARAQKNQKRGGAFQRVTFDQNLPITSNTPEDLIAIDDALQAFAKEHERKSRVVELRFFGGLSVEETAEALNISQETVLRDWKFAKSWLMRELARGDER